jgi:hypothetical protein
MLLWVVKDHCIKDGGDSNEDSEYIDVSVDGVCASAFTANFKLRSLQENMCQPSYTFHTSRGQS